MEKFRKFSDAQTGLNLFVPAFVNHQTSWLSYIFHIILALPLLLVRIPIIIILMLLSLLIYPISAKLTQFIARLILFVIGFYSIDYQVPLQEDAGSIILSNHSSPIDWLFYLQQCAPQFTQMIDIQGQISFEILTLFQVFKNLFKINVAKCEGNGRQLNQLCNVKKATLIFFEGTATNQSGVLVPPQDLLKQLQQMQPQIYIYVLSYSDRGLYTPINTTRNGIWHFILMCTNFSNSLRVVSQEFEKHSDYGKLLRNVYESEGFKMIQQPWSVIKEFQEYYFRTIKGNYIKQD